MEQREHRRYYRKCLCAFCIWQYLEQLEKYVENVLCAYLKQTKNDATRVDASSIAVVVINKVLKANKYDPSKSSPKTYLYSIGRNSVVDFLRKGSVRLDWSKSIESNNTGEKKSGTISESEVSDAIHLDIGMFEKRVRDLGGLNDHWARNVLKTIHQDICSEMQLGPKSEADGIRTRAEILLSAISSYITDGGAANSTKEHCYECGFSDEEWKSLMRRIKNTCLRLDEKFSSEKYMLIYDVYFPNSKKNVSDYKRIQASKKMQ